MENKGTLSKNNMKKTTTKKKSNALLSALRTKDTVTENGAVSHSTTGTAVLDFFGKGGSVRGQDANAISLFANAYKEDKTLALKVLFYLSDVRQGQGERQLFRLCFKWLAEQDSKIAAKLMKHIPEYTRFDNVLETLEGTELETKALELIAKQLRADLDADSSGGSPTLCAKWSPSEQASSAVTKRLASKLRKHMKMSPKDYRKMLSNLRKQIDVVERKMCENKWTKINYEGVPSRAASIYRKAFMRQDNTGYSKFLQQVEKGEKKINASVLYPYDIVSKFIHSSVADQTLELQWKALPDYLKDNPHNGIVVADVSGSMDSGSGSVAPINVAVSLAIYFAERNVGAFKDNFILFSDRASLKTLKGDTLAKKVQDVLASRPVANTNLQSVFNLILDKAVTHKVPESEMPSVLYIVSDMQFDSACSRDTNLEVIQKKYKAAGYKMPRIVFWNVNSFGDVPVKVDDKGVCLVSGCSPVILKSVLNNKITSPWDVMVQAVNVPRYEVIHA